MSKTRVPRQHRRYSLPATSSLSPFGFTRSFPEGSDIFQKAFEDLCTNEPNHAPNKSINEVGFNGLTNIQEGNESDIAESEDETDAPDDVISSTSRRHSSPSCFQSQSESETDLPEKSKLDKRNRDSVLRTHNRLRKEYFIKHGHWPVSKSAHPTVKVRPPSLLKDNVKSGVAFGSKVKK